MAGNVVVEFEELASDALVTPTRVVVGEADDKVFDLGWEGRSTPALAPHLAARRVTR
jgi:hypothetical protein